MKRPAILERLRGVQKAGDGWLAFCPGHDDRNKRSLSVGLGRDGRTLLNCHAAGCPPEQIARAVNMSLADLGPTSSNGHARATTRPTLATFAAKKHLDPALLIEAGWTDTPRGIEIPYKQRDGSVWRIRYRTSLEPGQGFLWDLQKHKALIPYGRWRLDEAHEPGELWLVEGASDTVTAWAHHLPCLGIPGNRAAKVLEAEDLVGIGLLWIVEEPGQSGRGFLVKLRERLRALKYVGTANVIRFTEKDLSDAHVAHGAALAAEITKAQAGARNLWAEDPAISTASATPAAPLRRGLVCGAAHQRRAHGHYRARLRCRARAACVALAGPPGGGRAHQRGGAPRPG